MQTANSADLRRELDSLQLMSEAEITERVRAGADATELLAKQDEIERKRKALLLTLGAAEHREREADKAEARESAAKLMAEMEHHRRLAAYALSDCNDAVAALEAAVALFDDEVRKASAMAAAANRVSRQAGLPDPVSHPDHNSELFAELAGRIKPLMHRRGQIYFDQHRINPEPRP